VNTYTFGEAPVRVYWELTRACDLACRHCRAEARPRRAADELTTAECEGVLAALAAARPRPPHVVLTGGDPLAREDLVHLVEHGTGLGLPMAVAPSATAGVTRPVVDALKRAGVTAMSLSLDGPTPAHHDGLRGVLGCFGWTLVAAQRIVSAGIPLQVNTLVTADSEPRLEEMAKVVAGLGASRWSLFFLVTVGRATALRGLGPRECEQRLRWLAAQAGRWPFTVSTTEAPHYRRVLLQHARQAGGSAGQVLASPIGRSFGIRDGNGIMFIAANGDVTPSGFLPLIAGNVRDADPVAIYRQAPLFQALRAPEALRGRCGICEYRRICGGSRARAWATSGSAFDEDPLCAYQPDGAAAGAATCPAA
jgi:radical SAM protein